MGTTGGASIKVTAWGKPVPADLKRSQHGRTYWPKNVVDWKDLVAQASVIHKLSIGNTWEYTDDDAFIVDLEFVFHRAAHLKPVLFLKKKHDKDKLERGVNDAITGILVPDDANIIDGHTSKRYTSDEESHVSITVRNLDA